MGIAETSDFVGMAACDYPGNPSAPRTPIEQDLSEFFDISKLSELDAEVALVHKISIRRA